MIQDVTTLTTENETLKKQVANAINQANGYVAQLDAHKQMLSEQIQANLNVRTNLIMFQRQIQDLQIQLKTANDSIAQLSSTKGATNAADKK